MVRERLKYGVIALLVAVLVMGGIPLPKASAAVTIYGVYVDTTDYFMAGYHYKAYVSEDKASSTKLKRATVEYSVDDGRSWTAIGSMATSNSDGINHFFTLPMGTEKSTVTVRFSYHFSPVFGSDSFPVHTKKTMPFLQPGGASDLVATANDDGTVSLKWYDNTNMESYYQVLRDGPDGTKSFVVRNTKSDFGWVTFTDTDTDKSESVYYGYTIYPIIDQYQLPDYLKADQVKTLVKTKHFINVLGNKVLSPKLPTIPTVPIIKKGEDIKQVGTIGKDLISFQDKWGVFVPDVDKVHVNSVKIDKPTLTLKIGESEQITAKVMPADAANKKVVWTSSDPDVAKVDSTGKVTGVATGLANITAKTEAGGLTATSVVTVFNEPIIEEIVEDKAPPAAPDPAPKFSDIAGHWAAAEIMNAYEQGVVSGYPNGTFGPDRTVTRAEFAVMLMNGLKPAVEGAKLTFKDSNTIGSWATKAVAQCVELGIIKGRADGTFAPNDLITHAEMLAMLVRAAKLPVNNEVITKYKDDASIPNWAKKEVVTAELYNIPGYITDNQLKPNANATRADSVTSILNMLKVK